MENGRRGFLKLFGLTSAAVAVAPGMGSTDSPVEVVTGGLAPEPPGRFPGLHSPYAGSNPNLQRHYSSAAMLDVRDEPLWSRIRIPANEMLGSYRLFNGPAVPQIFDPGETNLDRPGSLAPPASYCIKKIGFVFSPQTLPGLRSAFIDRYILRLYLGQKRYWEAPLAAVFSVGEPSFDNPGPNGKVGFLTLPDAGFMDLDIPLVIESDLYFNLELAGMPIRPAGKITAWAVFKGLHAVGIQ